jgi:hypothetical protein
MCRWIDGFAVKDLGLGEVNGNCITLFSLQSLPNLSAVLRKQAAEER